jgi:hypothetical protein
LTNVRLVIFYSNEANKMSPRRHFYILVLTSKNEVYQSKREFVMGDVFTSGCGLVMFGRKAGDWVPPSNNVVHIPHRWSIRQKPMACGAWDTE